MTTARKEIGAPFWPRGLSLEEAAAYVGVSPNTFRKEWEDKKLWPDPIVRGRRKIWDRLALDARFDELSGMAAPKTANGNIFSQRVRQWEEGRK